MRCALLALALVSASYAGPAAAREAYPADPLQSPMWTPLATSLFGDDPVRFDPRVRVLFPDIAENQRSFPVALDARGVGVVRRMILFADLNPIPVAVDYSPLDADAYVAVRIKLDQRTPVRGAVQLADGQWLVSGGWVDAAGGGCSAPPLSRVRGDWAEHLGEIRGEAWPLPSGAADGKPVTRLRVTFRHPMDTGLVANIPTYHLETLGIRSLAGAALGQLAIWASVAEDPAITLMPHAIPGDTLHIEGRDTNGRSYTARIPVSRQSALPGGPGR